jgi:hypothetical protein
MRTTLAKHRKRRKEDMKEEDKITNNDRAYHAEGALRCYVSETLPRALHEAALALKNRGVGGDYDMHLFTVLSEVVDGFKVDLTEAPEDAVCCLVIDLLHYCDREGIDFERDVLARARGSYRIDIEQEE